MSRESALFNRRTLLAGLGAGAVGAVAAAAPVLSLGSAGTASSGPGSWWDRTVKSLHAAGFAEWSRAVGQTFTLDSPNGTHKVRIAAVTAFPGSGRRPVELGRSQAFSVVFEPIAGPPLPAADRLYRLVHSSYPPLPIFMSAPAGLGRKIRLSAVFN